ncbi:MAG: hypothetical protein FJZ58_00320 [Chlamydiae bacterium]|nr:hypothetical protein [Chlamydiota bacterium]
MFRKFFICFFVSRVFAGQTIAYESTTAGESTPSEWVLQDVEGKIQVTGNAKGTDVEMSYSPSYALLQYKEKTNTAKELLVVKEGAYLFITNRDKGKEKILSHKVSDTPWVQDFKFGLQPFLMSDAKKYAFCIVHPEKLDVHEMVAQKDMEEVLEVGGKTYFTQKVKISLKGFKKKFWTGYVWFDTTTHLMVKYRANKGPGTPYTEMLLVGEKA